MFKHLHTSSFESVAGCIKWFEVWVLVSVERRWRSFLCSTLWNSIQRHLWGKLEGLLKFPLEPEAPWFEPLAMTTPFIELLLSELNKSFRTILFYCWFLFHYLNIIFFYVLDSTMRRLVRVTSTSSNPGIPKHGTSEFRTILHGPVNPKIDEVNPRIFGSGN